MRRLAPLFLALLGAACARGVDGGAPAAAFRDSVTVETPDTIDGFALRPEHGAVLRDSAAWYLLRRCSRREPQGVTAVWTPPAGEVRRMEAALSDYMLEVEPEFRERMAFWEPAYRADPGVRDSLTVGFRRQYAGFVAEGRRHIYVSFLPAEVAERTDFFPGVVWSWRTHAEDVCDGGPAFFGMEYDVETGRFDHLDFNGAV
ncbi:MAG TPA: hypothetical protein VHG91_18365 [Longimicrobium sp.]|nr:hypothetical protein [Longimicrobium sp.]